MATIDVTFDRAVAYARERGTRDGQNAAEWYVQDTFGSRVTRGAAESVRAILAGIDDGDPLIMDGLPFADLSGQWADSLTGPMLIVDALDAAGHSRETVHGATYGYCRETEVCGPAICDAYELAYSDAAVDTIAAAARATI